MKKTMLLLLSLLAVNASASYVLWQPLTQYKDIELPKQTAGFGVAKSARGVEWPDNYILQLQVLGEESLVDGSGNTVSSVHDWAEDKYEIGIQVGIMEMDSLKYCDPAFDNDGYTDVLISKDDDFWMNQALQFQLGHPEDSQMIVLELGYYDDEFNFYSFAYASDTFSDLKARYCYTQGTLDSPVQDWHPMVFTIYSPTIPEPSTGALFLIGTALMVVRKRVRYGC